jgi:hypothetical protein
VPIVGVLGFVLMFGGVLLAIAPPRRTAAAPEDVTDRPANRGGGSSAAQPGFMDKLNDRWDKRQDGHN